MSVNAIQLTPPASRPRDIATGPFNSSIKSKMPQSYRCDVVNTTVRYMIQRKIFIFYLLLSKINISSLYPRKQLKVLRPHTLPYINSQEPYLTKMFSA